MAAVLGLRGSGNFDSDERPKDWRNNILYLFPNGQAPLTALLSYLKNENTSDPQFHWWEKRLPMQRLQTNGTISSSATTLVVDSGAKDCVSGTLLINEVTGEIVKVTSTPDTDVSLEISRSWGTVAAATITDNDNLTIIGNVNEEGADPPTARAYAPVKKTNYTQIFRTSVYLTRTARRTSLRWDNMGPFREARRESFSLHSIEMEKASIWGDAAETIGDRGMPMRSTGGILSFLATNAPDSTHGGGSVGANNNWNIAGPIDEVTWDSRMEELFRYGSNERLLLCGSTFINAMNALAKRNGTLETTPKTTTYGMALKTYSTPFGDIHIKNHPLFSQHPVWRKNGLFIDVKHLNCRPLDDTRYITNRQSNGEDARMDEYLTEIGCEFHYEECHALMTGVDGFLAV